MGNILKPTWKLQDKSPTTRERNESISEANVYPLQLWV